MATILDLVGTDAKKLDDGVNQGPTTLQNVNNDRSIFYRAGQSLAAPYGEAGLTTTAVELGKDVAKGAVRIILC